MKKALSWEVSWEVDFAHWPPMLSSGELAKEVEMVEPTPNWDSARQEAGTLRVIAERSPTRPKPLTGLVASATMDSDAPEGEAATNAETSGHRLLLSIAEAAGSLGISRAHFYEFLNSKAVPTVRLGRRRMVRVDDLAAFVASLETILRD